MSESSRASSSKRFKSQQVYKAPKDLVGTCEWLRQVAAQNPGTKLMLNDDAMSIVERKENPAKWAMLGEAVQIINAERMGHQGTV